VKIHPKEGYLFDQIKEGKKGDMRSVKKNSLPARERVSRKTGEVRPSSAAEKGLNLGRAEKRLQTYKPALWVKKKRALCTLRFPPRKKGEATRTGKKRRVAFLARGEKKKKKGEEEQRERGRGPRPSRGSTMSKGEEPSWSGG